MKLMYKVTVAGYETFFVRGERIRQVIEDVTNALVKASIDTDGLIVAWAYVPDARECTSVMVPVKK